MLHQFCPEIAKDFNVNIAVFLQNMAYWTENNLANKRHIYDGYCWTYNSLEAFQKIFPYFSKQNLETIINTCLKNGLMIKGNYNKKKYDRTGWYALTPLSYKYFKQLVETDYINLLGEAFKAISYYQEMDFLESRNGFLETKTAIPNTKPQIKESITFSNTKENNKSLVNTKSQPLSTLQKINTLDLPIEYLEQLVAVRKANKASVSKLSMEAVYQELIKLKDAGFDLNECLNMYANCGWKGFIAEWFINSKTKNQSNHLDHDSMAWAEGFKNNPLYDMESYKNGR
jgi:hypothetical protein